MTLHLLKVGAKFIWFVQDNLYNSASFDQMVLGGTYKTFGELRYHALK